MKFDIIKLETNSYKYVLIAENGFEINIGNNLSKFERSYLRYVIDNEPNNSITVELVVRTYNEMPYTMVVLLDLKRNLSIDLRLGSFKNFVVKEIEYAKTKEVI